MLSVEPQQPPSLQDQTIDMSQPSELSQMENMMPKQQLKKSLLTPLNIIIILSVVAILGLGTYYLLDLSPKADPKSSITQSQDNIISHAGSSKNEGSSSGGSSSKSSSGNSKANPHSHPASKNPITSNPGLGGKMGSGGDEPDPNDEEDNGQERDKKLKKDLSTTGTSTEDDQEDDEDEEDQNADDGVYWVDTKLQGNNASPLVGKKRP